MENQLIRSWMFVPGHRQKMIEKAMSLAEIDAIMLDIEDGVPPAEKENARAQIAAALASPDSGAAGQRRFVRINSVGHEWMHADLARVIQPGTHGIVPPKVESAEQVRLVDKLIGEREAQAKLPAGKIRLLVAIESPLGLLNAYSIASASPRVMGLLLGAEDMGKGLGLPLRREGEARELLHVRGMLAVTAAAAGVQAVDSVWTDLQDPEGLRRYAQQARRLGFSGMSMIHPSQAEIVNHAFSPTDEELAYCEQVVQAYDEAVARGQGAIAFGGQLLDPPIVDRARRTLAARRRSGARQAP